MKINNGIRFLTNKQIDRSKWEACIDRTKGLIYARCFYLDHMSKHWDALVLNDYEAVMPLTWNRKWGVYYLYQPFFSPALGVFGLPDNNVDHFIQLIPSHFKYLDIAFNECNHILVKNHSRLLNTRRVNYILPIDKSYSEIQGGYKRLAKRMLKKAKDAGISIVKGIPPTELINLYKKEFRDKHSGVSDEVYRQFSLCTEDAVKLNMAETYTAQSEDNEIIGVFLVLIDNNHVYSILGGNIAEGKDKAAFYKLTDHVIQRFAGFKKTFRFEGSDIEGIAFFNSQFGAEKTYYSHVKVNMLPFPINLIKK